MTDPYTLLFIAACTAITGVVAPIIAEYAKSRFSDLSGKASLHATIAELQKRDVAHEKDMATAQAKYLEIQSKYDERFSREAIRAKYSVDEPTGDLVLDGIHFCSPCFHDGHDPPHEIQMRKTDDSRFQCPKCNLPHRLVKQFKMPGR